MTKVIVADHRGFQKNNFEKKAKKSAQKKRNRIKNSRSYNA